jgi:hypothetical protein
VWRDDLQGTAYTYIWQDGAWHGNRSCEPMLPLVAQFGTAGADA